MIVASPQRHHGVTASMLDMRMEVAGPGASGILEKIANIFRLVFAIRERRETARTSESEH
jgi:hypothetical protein